MKIKNTTLIAPAAPAQERFCFRWWYKALVGKGVTMTLKGIVVAPDSITASDWVEAEMRKQWPDARWMQGREIESDGIRFGPTVQKMKRAIPFPGNPKS